MEQLTQQQLQRLLTSPETARLLSILSRDPAAAARAASAAKAGDSAGARAILAPLLDGTEASQLAQELGKHLG